MVTKPTDNLDAYNLYLKGRYFVPRLRAGGLEKGLEYFTQALALEPNYAQAHAGIAKARSSQAILSFVSPDSAMPLAREAAIKALSIDDTLSEGHHALGIVLNYYDWDWEGAEQEYRRALELNPGDAHGR